MLLAASVRFSFSESVNAKAMKCFCAVTLKRNYFRETCSIKQRKLLTRTDQSACLL